MLTFYYVLGAILLVLFFGSFLLMLYSMSGYILKEGRKKIFLLLGILSAIGCFYGLRQTVIKIDELETRNPTVEVIKELTIDWTTERRYEEGSYVVLRKSDLCVRKIYAITESGKEIYLGKNDKVDYMELYPIGDTITVADNKLLYPREWLFMRKVMP